MYELKKRHVTFFIARSIARSPSAGEIVLSGSAALYATSCRIRLECFLTAHLRGSDLRHLTTQDNSWTVEGPFCKKEQWWKPWKSLLYWCREKNKADNREFSAGEYLPIPVPAMKTFSHGYPHEHLRGTFLPHSRSPHDKSRRDPRPRLDYNNYN